jgi:hypothetical protein
VTKALKAVIDRTSEQISAVQTYLSKIFPPDGASKLERALKALKSLSLFHCGYVLTGRPKFKLVAMEDASCMELIADDG